jgi:hypothetical protein
MTKRHELRFKLAGKIGDHDVSPDWIPADLLLRYLKNVVAFVAGSKSPGRLNPRELPMQIRSGSLEAVVGDIEADATVWSDFKTLRQDEASLDRIDRKRRHAMLEFQKIITANPSLEMAINSRASQTLRITAKSNFRISDDDRWYATEKWITGEILDTGGAEPNLNILLPDGGKLVVATTKEQQAREAFLTYHQRRMHISAQAHFDSGELRDARLIGFAPETTKYHPSMLDSFIEEGASAWAGIDGAKWVRDVRGQR